MSHFVNYAHQAVTLPKGFNDLIDLLPTDGKPSPAILRKTTEGLRQLEGYLSNLLSSSSRYSLLSILGFDLEGGMYLEKSKSLLTASVVIKPPTATKEHIVRQLFSLAGLEPLTDDPPAATSLSCILKYSLRPSIPDLPVLIREVLRAVCGATDHAGLYYGYYCSPVA